MRRPPHGGRRVECANREMSGAAAMECVSDRISEQFSPRAVQECVLEMHYVVAAPRISRCA
eukprot:9766522-Lingulodinium_polyedra.AAC.1